MQVQNRDCVIRSTCYLNKCHINILRRIWLGLHNPLLLNNPIFTIIPYGGPSLVKIKKDSTCFSIPLFSIYEASIGGYQYLISLEVNRKVPHIPLSKLENVPFINFPKYPIFLEVNKNIPENSNTK